MGKYLKDFLGGAGRRAAATTTAPPAAGDGQLFHVKSEDDETRADASVPAGTPAVRTADFDSISIGDIESVECEAVVGGALQRIRFGAVNPAMVGAFIKFLDPAAKVRDDFPRGGMGMGKRDTKLTRAMVINADIRDMGKFVDIICQNGDDIKVSVSKKSADEFLGKIEALNKLSDKNLAKLQHAFADKKTATIMLREEEQFGVTYWTTEDGKMFMDGVQVEPPAEHVESDGGEGVAK